MDCHCLMVVILKIYHHTEDAFNNSSLLELSVAGKVYILTSIFSQNSGQSLGRFVPSRFGKKTLKLVISLENVVNMGAKMDFFSIFSQKKNL